MGKLILQMQTSVDGYVGRVGEGPAWQVWDWGPEPTWDELLLSEFNRFLEDADAILLSRKIVEGGYIRHWTQMAERFARNSPFAFAHRVVEMRKVVFSRSELNLAGPNVEVARRPLAEEVTALKAGTPHNIVAFGGAGFARALIGAGLVDEFQFYINPAALGEGLSIFERGRQANLRLLGTRGYACGIAVTRYEAVGASS